VRISTPVSINNAGTVVGSFNYFEKEYGFELNGSTYSKLVFPGAEFTTLRGITSAGTVVGYGEAKRVAFADFSYAQGQYHRFAIPNAPGALVLAVNPSGTALAGQSPTSQGSAGFVYTNRILTVLQFPGSAFAYAQGVNSAGEVVGWFYEGSGNQVTTHGFTWTP
jgi:probable HAF family extracellular repeat protein